MRNGKGRGRGSPDLTVVSALLTLVPSFWPRSRSWSRGLSPCPFCPSRKTPSFTFPSPFPPSRDIAALGHLNSLCLDVSSPLYSPRHEHGAWAGGKRPESGGSLFFWHLLGMSQVEDRLPWGDSGSRSWQGWRDEKASRKERVSNRPSCLVCSLLSGTENLSFRTFPPVGFLTNPYCAEMAPVPLGNTYLILH